MNRQHHKFSSVPLPRAIPILDPAPQEPCPELAALLEEDYSEDPISVAYGIGDMWQATVRAHQRRCAACRRLTVMS